MEIKFINVRSLVRKRFLILIMRMFIFLLCTTVFGFTAINSFSQEKIIINSDKVVSVHEVFRIIKEQTKYRFLYPEYLFKEAPKVELKKGTIALQKLLVLSLSGNNLNFKLSEDNVIVINENNNEQLTIQEQQGIPIAGIVTDENDQPFPGVNILEEGTTNGTTTDILGNYTISVTNNDAVLVFSFVGFITKKVVVNEQTEINLSLLKSVVKLDEVSLIFTGYQKISRDKITGAAQNIEQSYYENSYRPTLQEGLQGSVAGLQILSNNNHPQAIPQVIIRGVGSAFQEGVGFVGFGTPKAVLGNPIILTPGSPLYVIDGVPTFDGSDLSSINGNDIKSISVLKDASATSIYGARAANGVIVIETKSGKTGRYRATYSTQIGFSKFTNLNKRLNTVELQELYIEGLINNSTNKINTEADALSFLLNPGGSITPFNPNQNTNWEDELTRTSVMKQHNLSVSGGKGTNNYYLSLGYLKNETPLKDIDFDRVTARLKYNTEVSKKFDITVNIGYGKTQSNNHETGTSFYNPYRNIYALRPDLKIYNNDGSYDTSYNFAVNPLGILTDEARKLETNDFRGSLNMNYELVSDLTIETSFSGNYKLTENYNSFPEHIGKGFNNRSSFGIQKNIDIFTWNTRALLRYDMQFGDNHNFSTFVGVESSATDTKITNVSVDQLRSGAETLDNGNTVHTYTGRNESAISSLFLNADYNYQGKYLVNASFRRDGSSRFGSNNKYGNFYAIGSGWNIHKEDFMENVDAINILKLRVSYGVNGNDQIGLFNYVGTFNGTSFYNGENVVTIASAGNSSLGWEENSTFDIGVDFSLYNNRISGFIDYYSRNTDKLLYNLPVSSFNADNFIFRNFGGMKNSGFEISLNTKNITSENNGFRWTTGITFTTNKNEITKLAKDEIISGNYIRKIGEDFNTLNIYGYAGVDSETGSELFYTDETETETTTNYREAVKYNHGKTTPDFYSSLTNTVSFKNLSLTALFYTSWGGQVFETSGNTQNDNGSLKLRDYSNTSRAVYDRRWQKSGDITDVPKYVYGNTRSLNKSSRWLHDASYIRLKKLELAYNFPKKVLEKILIDRLRLYVSADNIWTYIKDDTLDNDPEIGGITGAASFDTPLTKIVYFGLNVSF